MSIADVALPGSRPQVSGALQRVLAFALLVLLGALAFGLKLFEPISPQDEGILLVYPDLILRGYLPYTDFAVPYAPGTFYVIATTFQMFGSSLMVERVIGMGYQALLVTAAYLLGSKVTPATGVGAAIASLGALYLFPIPGAFSIFGALALALFALFCACRSAEIEIAQHRQRWAQLAGFLVGLTFWFRQDVGTTVLLATAVMLGSADVRSLKHASLGLALPAIGFAVFTLLIGPAFVLDCLMMDILRQAPGRNLPLRITASLAALVLCVVANVVAALAVSRLRTNIHLVCLVRGSAVLSICLLPSALQRADIYHIAYLGAALAALTVASVSIVLLHLRAQMHLSKNAVVVLLAAGIAASGAALVKGIDKRSGPHLRIVSADRWVFSEDLSYLNGRSLLEDANALVGELRRVGKPGERLFIGPNDLRFANYNDTFLYFLLPHLQPAARYLEMNPGVANRVEARLADQIETADWVVKTLKYAWWSEPNASLIPGPTAANEVVARNFCPYADFGVWQLLRRCGRADARTQVPD